MERSMGPVVAQSSTDASGRFSIHVNYLHVEDAPACAILEAVLPDAGLRIESNGHPVFLRQEGAGKPLDSLNVTLQDQPQG
jgi:hypothetical protein